MEPLYGTTENHFTRSVGIEMSRNKNNRNPKQYSYNRQSKGYQQNLYKQKLKEENIQAPKNTMTEKKLKRIIIGFAIGWGIATVLLILYLKWWGLLIGVVVGAAAVGGMYLYLNHKRDELIRYYKQLGMTEDMYINELKKRGTDVKQIEATRKAWRKVKIDK